MVRLEIQQLGEAVSLPITFTFQYGQIRNSTVRGSGKPTNNIYIPVWLDQKYT